MKIQTIALALCLGLLSAGSAQATEIVLTFDEFADGTELTTQYQSLGVTAAGVTILDTSNTTINPQSSPNVAFALTGLMMFDLNTSVIGDIQTVSAYVSGPADTGIYAYDSFGVLLDQALLPIGAADNTLLSVTSLGNSIFTILIHDGGSTFVIDDLTIISAVPEPSTVWLLALGLLSWLGVARRKALA